MTIAAGSGAVDQIRAARDQGLLVLGAGGQSDATGHRRAGKKKDYPVLHNFPLMIKRMLAHS